MCERLMIVLFTEQLSDPPKIAASKILKKATKAYLDGEIIKSANSFLKAWQILNKEYQNYIAGRLELLPPWNADVSKLDLEVVAHESRERLIMSFCSLTDLALACLGCTGKYKFIGTDGCPSYTFNCFPLENSDIRLTTAENLELGGDI
jgi:hypothetical protein